MDKFKWINRKLAVQYCVDMMMNNKNLRLNKSIWKMMNDETYCINPMQMSRIQLSRIENEIIETVNKLRGYR